MMRVKILFPALFIIGLLLNVSCSKEGELSNDNEGIELRTASLSVTISGKESSNIGKSKTETRALGTPTQAEENKIFNYSIYVFYPNGTLEKVETLSGGTLTKNVTGLTAGAKQVVILANVPTGFPTITNYNDLATAMFNLDTQEASNLSTTGLAMSGEATTTLASGNANTLTVPVSRIVAKIKLGGITINAAPGHDPSKFDLVAVHIMKVKANTTMGVPTVVTDNTYYGGMMGLISSTNKTYLTESISTGNENCYFYVFPNDNSSNNATLFVIEGKYNNVTNYFSFRINENTITPGDGTGEFIKRNTVHTINVVLKKLGGGTTDPEQPSDPTSLDVTIVPEDWKVIPDQNVEW